MIETLSRVPDLLFTLYWKLYELNRRIKIPAVLFGLSLDIYAKLIEYNLKAISQV